MYHYLNMVLCSLEGYEILRKLLLGVPEKTHFLVLGTVVFGVES